MQPDSNQNISVVEKPSFEPKISLWRRILKNKKLRILVAIIGSWTILLLIYYLAQGGTEPQPEPPFLPSPTSTGAPVKISDLNDPSTWVEHKTGDFYNLKYPPQIEKKVYGDNIEFVYEGQDAVPNVEYNDGFVLKIDTGVLLQDQSFLDYVQSQHSAEKESLTNLSVGELSLLEIANTQGYEFSKEALGTYRIIYLPVSNENKYLRLSVFTQGENKQEYEEIVSNILSSLEIN